MEKELEEIQASTTCANKKIDKIQAHINGILKRYKCLQQSNKDLIDALEEIIKTVEPMDVYIHRGEPHVGSKGQPSDKSIHMAIKALNNAKNLNHKTEL